MSNILKFGNQIQLNQGLTLPQFNLMIGNASGVSINFDTSSAGNVEADPVSGLLIKSGVITNSMVNASAAIAYSKLSLSNSIVNADINSSAAIAYSKLSLSGSIVNADINASAAIAYSKLNLAASVKASDINSGAATNGQVLTANGSGGAAWSNASAGTVTSVALADASTSPIFAVSGSPITSSGTLTLTLQTQSANVVFAGPSSGSAAQPSFRSLVANDIPSLSSLYESVNNFSIRSYQNSISLAASTSSPTNIASLDFAFASIGAEIINYMIVEASTNARRMGTIRVSTDGTNVGFADEYVESVQLGNGIVFSAVISGSNVNIQFSGTGTNACTMRAEISAFSA
jgi:hypothetical protein